MARIAWPGYGDEGDALRIIVSGEQGVNGILPSRRSCPEDTRLARVNIAMYRCMSISV